MLRGRTAAAAGGQLNPAVHEGRIGDAMHSSGQGFHFTGQQPPERDLNRRRFSRCMKRASRFKVGIPPALPLSGEFPRSDKTLPHPLIEDLRFLL